VPAILEDPNIEIVEGVEGDSSDEESLMKSQIKPLPPRLLEDIQKRRRETSDETSETYQYKSKKMATPLKRDIQRRGSRPNNVFMEKRMKMATPMRQDFCAFISVFLRLNYFFRKEIENHEWQDESKKEYQTPQLPRRSIEPASPKGKRRSISRTVKNAKLSSLPTPIKKLIVER
jgi:sulfite reductase alpha subunit-like flavoprotein